MRDLSAGRSRVRALVVWPRCVRADVDVRRFDDSAAKWF